MSKRRRKRKKNNKNKYSNMSQNNKTKESIVEALIEYDKIKELKMQNKKDEENKEFDKIVGYKECDKVIFKFLNRTKVFFKILFLKEKDINNHRFSMKFVKMILSVIFEILIFICLIPFFVEIMLLFVYVAEIILNMVDMPLINMCDINLINALKSYRLGVINSVLFLLFARIFSLVNTEIKKTEDESYLLGFSSIIISLIAIIISLFNFH